MKGNNFASDLFNKAIDISQLKYWAQCDFDFWH